MTAAEIIDEARLRQIEGRWKSDVDLKLDRMIAFVEKNETFIDMLIEREASRARLRTAVIEKTLSGLILTAVVGLLSLAWSGLSMNVTAAWQSIKK